MKIFKTRMVTQGEGGGLTTIDTIEFEGKLWLVPEWLDNKAEGWTMPARIVHPLKDQFSSVQADDYDYLLSRLIPINVIYGPIQIEEEDTFEVVNLPPIQIRGGFGVN